MTATTDPRIALYQCALGVAKDAIEAFTNPEGRMPADTGEFKDLKTALVAIRTVYPLCDEFRPTQNLLAERDKLKALNAELVAALYALIDVWDDHQNNAPEYRCYVEEAWPEVLKEAHAVLAKHKETT